MNFFVKGEDLKRTEMFYIHTLRAFIISISNCFDHFNITLNNIFTIKRVPMVQMPAYRGSNTKQFFLLDRCILLNIKETVQIKIITLIKNIGKNRC